MHGPALPRGLYPSVCWIFNLPLVLPSHSSLSPSLPSPRQGVSNISLAASLLPSKLCTLRYTAQAFHGKCGFKVQWIQNQIHCTLFAKRPEPQIEWRFTTTWHCRVKVQAQGGWQFTPVQNHAITQWSCEAKILFRKVMQGEGESGWLPLISLPPDIGRGGGDPLIPTLPHQLPYGENWMGGVTGRGADACAQPSWSILCASPTPHQHHPVVCHRFVGMSHVQSGGCDVAQGGLWAS